MNGTHKFPCGCEIPIIDGHPQINYNKLNYDCPKTWQIYCNGQTQSVFQLEKYLGKHWSKKCKPNSIEDASAIIAAIRPGVLQATNADGISMTEIYAKSKNREITVENLPILEPILEETSGVYLFQEQIMAIARDIAGFDGAAQNKLRKGVGKKDADLLNSLREEFIEGCKKQGIVTESQANFIFDQFRESARYLFNKCLSPSTMVETYDGYKTIAQLNIGEFVYGPYGYVEVIAKHKNGKKECYRASFVDGPSIICTLDHKFECENGEIKSLAEVNHDLLKVKCEYMGGFLYRALDEIKYYGEIDTMDITVDSPDHLFYANGIATSNSHSVGYAITGYWTAWVKAHLPRHYVCAWLRIAKNEQKPLEEIRSMISEAHRLTIPVLPPSIKNIPKTDFFVRDKKIYFGITSIKNCSDKSVAKLINSQIDLENISWIEFLVMYSHLLSKTQAISMIQVGCFDYTGESRMRCEFEYGQWISLKERQKKLLKELYSESPASSFEELLENFQNSAKKCSEKDKNLVYISIALRNPPYPLDDSKTNIVANERALLGINVSCSKVDNAKMPDAKDTCSAVSKKNSVNCNNKERYKVYVLIGEITDYNEFKIKNGKLAGKLMANFKLVDETGECDVVIFPEKLDLYQAAMYDENTVLIKGKLSNRGGIICDEVYEV